MAGREQATVRSIAVHAGVSHMTAARALRGDAHVAPATRERVLQAAESLGYRRNPIVSTLMSAIRCRHVAAYRGKLAWLHAGASPRSMYTMPWQRPLFQGVCDRAEQTGYLLDVVWLNGLELKAGQLTKLLLARGVQGLIIPALHPALADLDWSRFVAAATTVLPQSSLVHQAGTHFAHGMRECTDQLRSHGYRRIGLAMHGFHNREHRELEHAVHLLDAAAMPPRDRVPFLLHAAQDDAGCMREFGLWVRRCRPDAVICYDENVLGWVRALGMDVPGELGLAHLNRHDYLVEWAGIDQHEEQIGAAAVDLVVGQIARGEVGLPPFQKQLLIKGEWVEGRTVCPVRAPLRAPFAATRRGPRGTPSEHG